jgi:hypothetical protein
MSLGYIDLRNIISGSSNEGTWNFMEEEHAFILSERKPYKVTWKKSEPTGSEEIENRISNLAEHFFGECIIN